MLRSLIHHLQTTDRHPVRSTGSLSLVLLLAGALLAPPTAVLAEDSIGGRPIAEVSAEISSAAPDVEMEAGVLMTADGRELWSRDPEAERAMASTTKIMTAVVVLENAGLDEIVTVSRHAATVGESAADLRTGDTYTVEKLLEALLVKSGNDAAVALAEHVGGSEEAFVEMMNAKAEELGLTGTHYANSHGLDQAGHYTTARDLGALSRYAMAKDDFRRIVGMLQTTITSGRGTHTLYSSNELLLTFQGADGVKTGWTSDAGYCLAASAKRGDIELTAIVLGASSEEARFQQAARLLEWGFSHYTTQVLASEDETMGAVPVSDYLDVNVTGVLPEGVVTDVFDLDGPVQRIVTLEPEVDAPVTLGDRIGTLEIAQGERLIAQVPIVASSNVIKPSTLEALWIAIQRVWRGIFGEPAPA